MDFDENDVIPQETETNGFMLASHEQIKEFAKTGNFYIMTVLKGFLNRKS